MKIFLPLFLCLCAGSALRADVLANVVEITPPSSWMKTDPRGPGEPSSPLPTLRYAPKDGRNAMVLLTFVPPEYAQVTELESLKKFFRQIAGPYLPTPEAKLMAEEVKLPAGVGIFATFEDPRLVGEPVKKGTYKCATPVAVLLTGGGTLHITILTDSKDGADLQEAFKIVQSAKLTGQKSPVASVTQGSTRQIVRVPALGSVLLLPSRFKPMPKANSNPGYFSFADEKHVNLSGWIDRSTEFKNMNEFWAKEKNTLTQQGGFAIAEESFKTINGWSAVLYVVQLPNLPPQRNIRACRVAGDTWADVHLSIVDADATWKDLEDVMRSLSLVPK